jgi:hypothetical protein
MSVGEISVYWLDGQRLIADKHTEFTPSPILIIRATSYQGGFSHENQAPGAEKRPRSGEITNAKVLSPFPMRLHGMDNFLWLTQNVVHY